jgi:hypothetical protein
MNHKKNFIPWTSITIKAPKVILAPLSNLPLTKATVSLI